jgi:DNA repair protein RecO (recombination protein O)
MAAPRATPPLAAYVLHSYDWSESSLIVELFTRAQGRLVVVAKGAKRPTSNFRPMLLPFHALTVWLARASADESAEVRGLRAVEWGGGAPLPPAALMSGFYLNELLLKGLARQDPHAALFDAYADTLATLAVADLAEEVVLRAFEFVLLRELGLMPDLDRETASAQPLQPDRRYTLRAETGVVPDTEGASAATWVSLQAALQHGSLGALRQACAAEAAALRAPLRALVHNHLATAQLRTRRVGLEMQRLASTPGR